MSAAAPIIIIRYHNGNLTSSKVVNSDIDAAAAIFDTKLNTISTALKVSNSATTANNDVDLLRCKAG
jgi:hypothetical protein